MRGKKKEGEGIGVLRQFLWVTVIMTGFLLLGYSSPQEVSAGHTTSGAWAEYSPAISCVHCHKMIIVSGNPDGSNREIMASPSITGSSRATHAKRSNWSDTVSGMLSKCGGQCPGSSATDITNYLNAYYCTSCSAPYYYIT